MQETSNVGQTKLVTALTQYLNCPCRYFPPMPDDDPIMEAYREARKRGETEGFVPMLVTADETLWECLVMNVDGACVGDEAYAFDAEKVAAYRQKMLQTPLKESKEVICELIQTRQGEAADDDLDWTTEVVGEIAGGEELDRFCGFWDFGTGDTMPLLLAEIPVKHPWEVFAYLPFGGWNECPDTPDLMAVTKNWGEQYGAIPAVLTHDVLEFDVPVPVEVEKALELALEQYAWCPDVVDQCQGDDATVGMLADTLTKSSTWYFWWD